MAGKPGRSGAPGVTRRGGPGRSPQSATIKTGAGIMASIITPDGGQVFLGRGKAKIERVGMMRQVRVLLPNGDELRVLID